MTGRRLFPAGSAAVSLTHRAQYHRTSGERTRRGAVCVPYDASKSAAALLAEFAAQHEVQQRALRMEQQERVVLDARKRTHFQDTLMRRGRANCRRRRNGITAASFAPSSLLVADTLPHGEQVYSVDVRQVSATLRSSSEEGPQSQKMEEDDNKEECEEEQTNTAVKMETREVAKVAGAVVVEAQLAGAIAAWQTDDQASQQQTQDTELAGLLSRNLDVFGMTEEELIDTAACIITHSTPSAHPDPIVLRNFLTTVFQGYQDNPYHNARHGFDVYQGAVGLVQHPSVRRQLGDTEMWALCVAALCHDLGHTGTSNAFHTATVSELALRYSFRAPLESHHASQAMRIMHDPNTDVLAAALSPEERQRALGLVVDIIMATDMASHATQLAAFCETFPADRLRNEDEQSHLSVEEMSVLLQNVVKMADISNTTRPTNLAAQWSRRITDEFFAQGDEEKRRGMKVLPFMDRDQPQNKVGFHKFVALPFFQAMTARVPGTDDLLQGLQANIEAFSAEEK